MKRVVIWFTTLAVAGILGFWLVTSPELWRSWRGKTSSPDTATIKVFTPDLANGRTMFFAGGCSSCHATPGQDDRTRLGGGLPLHSPFGTFYVPNITPHTGDGIGGWNLKQFMIAMREGVSPDGAHYYPAFPYTSYQRAAPQDLADLFAYLMTLTPLEGRAPAHELPFPFNIRRMLGGWKLLYLDGKAFAPQAGKSPEWNRGAYLTQAFGHCAECHSPRDMLGGIVEKRRYAGGPNPDGKGSVPNITPHATGVGAWSRADMIELLTTGVTPNYDSVSGSMRAVVKNTSELSPSDRAAMATYLAALPARETIKRPAR